MNYENCEVCGDSVEDSQLSGTGMCDECALLCGGVFALVM